MSNADPTPNWGHHLQIVFSVLVSVSFAQCFTLVGQSQFSLYQLLLIATVFFVVLDNWYNLNWELLQAPVAGAPAVILYLLALISYSCLPFLYLSRTATTVGLGPPEFLMVNLSAICLLDAVRRTVAIRHFSRRSEVSRQEQERVGKNFFLTVTGYLYALLLALVAAASSSAKFDLPTRAGSVLAIWLVVRGIDTLLMPRVSLFFYRLVTSGPDETPAP